MEEAIHRHEKEAIKKSSNQIKITKYIFRFFHEFRKQLRESYIICFEKFDVIIANRITLPITISLAEKMNKKIIYSYFMPPMIETNEFPVPYFAFFNNPTYNKFTYRIHRWIVWRALKKDTNEFRKELGLPVFTKNISKYLRDRQIPSFFSLSPQLIPQPKDWESRYKITGFLTVPISKREHHKMDEIPNGLTEWLESGDKPVYIGFGSIPIPNGDNFGKILNEILEKSAHRIIFCEGWTKLPNLAPHPNLFVIQHTNHEWLMPKCTSAVIHGGAGSLAVVLKSEIPVIVASVFFDQPNWGKIVEQKKLGKHIPAKKLNFTNLLNAINETELPDIRLNASEIGRKINKEDGLKSALNFITHYSV